MQETLHSIADRCRGLHRQGTVARYIPELAKAPADLFALSAADVSGERWSAGRFEHPFTMQSISKVVTLLLALTELGEEEVFRHVGRNPSSDPFNSIMRLEMADPHRPQNPLINAGAIAVTSLLPFPGAEERSRAILSFARRLTGNPALAVDDGTFRSERETGDRNRSLAYFLKSLGNLEGDPCEVLEAYFRQCSILVTTEDLAMLGATLASGGVCPATGERVVAPRACRIALALMVTCGLYDGSGEFAVRVGLPAKSGVAGGIVAVVPERMGIAVCGPALDGRGNSVSGMRALELLSEERSLRVF
ncbi:MAG: glutaminase A [Synergistales bacterium]|nr:glutaminase A [Synergistales bacterium]